MRHNYLIFRYINLLQTSPISYPPYPKETVAHINQRKHCRPGAVGGGFR